MKKDPKSLATLAAVEREVLVECREWGRRRREQRLQELADQTGEVFPPCANANPGPLTQCMELGLVKLTVDYGRNPHTQKWLCPQQQARPGGAWRWMTRSFMSKCSARASAPSNKPKPGSPPVPPPKPPCRRARW